MDTFLKKSFSLLLKRQTNILSAAFVIMATVILSHILGLVKQRLLVTFFGVSTDLGIFEYASLLPETVFQLTISAALSSAFIPVFTDYLSKGEAEKGHKMASTLLLVGFILFSVVSTILIIFAPFFLSIFNSGANFSPEQIMLMSNLMRLFIIGQMLFVVGTFFSALLQSYNQFFVPGIALALYNLGIIIGVLLFSKMFGIYSAPIGVIIGAVFFVLAQIPVARHTGFSFKPSFHNDALEGIKKIGYLMWPRTLSLIVFQFGTLSIASFIAFLSDPGRNINIYNLARTLAFAPVTLFGQPIAQAALPILSREKKDMAVFKQTFMASFNQMLYIILPISVLILVLRIPIVRLVYGADKVDWLATVSIGRTLALFSLSIFAQALVALALRAFYALHSTKIPLIVGAISTGVMLACVYIFVVIYHFGVESFAAAYSIGNIVQLILLLILLDKRVGGFEKRHEFSVLIRYFFISVATAFALYIPIKLLDQLVFDTTRTVNLLILTGISSFFGLGIYLFLSWYLQIHEAKVYLEMLKRVKTLKEILYKGPETIEGGKFS